MTVSSIISAIGNNSSIYPLIIRDCGIEVPTKVYKTYKQNKDDKEIAYLATRERLIDEYATSAVWLGGIPLIGKICNSIIKSSGYSPLVNIKLINTEEKLQKIDTEIQKYGDKTPPKELLEKREKYYIQSLSGNIEKFSMIDGTQEAVENLKKIKLNQIKYKNLQACKLFAEIAIPISLMGYVIPKSVYALTAATRKKMDRLKNLKKQNSNIVFEGISLDKFVSNSKKDISFNGNISSALCNMTTVQKMAATDGGYAAGRVATARKKRGAVDIAFRMAGMMYLNFVAPKQIEKILNTLSGKIFNLNINLDPIILGDKNFIEQINNQTLELPKSNNIKDILEFVDNTKNSKTLFVKYAKELELIKFMNNDIRDPRAYVNEDKIATLRDNIEQFMKDIQKIKNETTEKLINSNLSMGKIEKAIKKYVKKYTLKAKTCKTFNIISNVALSSYLLACVLPDVQYLLREKFLGTKLEPDLIG